MNLPRSHQTLQATAESWIEDGFVGFRTGSQVPWRCSVRSSTRPGAGPKATKANMRIAVANMTVVEIPTHTMTRLNMVTSCRMKGVIFAV